MKKYILALIVLIIPIITSAYIIGDVNNDEKVSSLDYLLIKKHILRTSELTADALKRADVDNNGVVNALDYINIRKIIINGKEPTPSVSVSKISLNSSMVIEVGEIKTLKATIEPANATDKTITWTSSDSSIVTVNQDGTIKGNRQGKAIITASCGNVSTTVEIRVSSDIIHFIHTSTGGYGNAILIESNGEYAMFDASDHRNTGKVIDKYLNNLGIDSKTPIKYVIVSHMHDDHAAYIDEIILKRNVKNIIYKNYYKECSSSESGDTYQKMYTDILNAVKKKGVNRVDLGKKDGSKKIKVGNFTISFYNVGDRYCYGDNKGHVSLNVDSLGIVLSITKNNKEMLTYLAGDMQNGKYDEEETIANKVAKDYNYKVFDVYQAAHHGVNMGIDKSKLKFKYPIITHSIGSLCNRHLTKADGVAESVSIIYNHMKNNNKLYFSSARSVQVNYTNKGITINGGEVLECSDKTCKDGKKAWQLLNKKSVKGCDAYVLEN